jgi:hypothetical protein
MLKKRHISEYDDYRNHKHILGGMYLFILTRIRMIHVILRNTKNIIKVA